MIFVTVGAGELPFDRLLRAVASPELTALLGWAA
jgi:UDP-N-acetylglucosamine transferase subunit ALG13